MTDTIITLIILVAAMLLGFGYGIAILIDIVCSIKEKVLDIMEKYFPRLYYYDYDDEA